MRSFGEIWGKVIFNRRYSFRKCFLNVEISE